MNSTLNVTGNSTLSTAGSVTLGTAVVNNGIVMKDTPVYLRNIGDASAALRYSAGTVSGFSLYGQNGGILGTTATPDILAVNINICSVLFHH